MRAILPPLRFCSIALILISCAHRQSVNDKPEVAPSETPAAEVVSEHDQLSRLQDKVQDLETRLSALNDKINLENGVASSSPNSNTNIPTAVVEVPPAHAKVIPHVALSSKKSKTPKGIAVESESRSEAVDRYREAKILYETKRYSDAVLEFSQFIKNEPDHPLASGAQYFLGMSYLAQKENKLAEEELSRGLLSYPHSSYVPDTLAALMKVSELLKKPTKVVYYREKLMNNFPTSPQAKKLGGTEASESSEAEPAAAPEKKATPTTASAVAPEEMKTMIEPTVVEPKVNAADIPTLAPPVLENDN